MKLRVAAFVLVSPLIFACLIIYMMASMLFLPIYLMAEL